MKQKLIIIACVFIVLAFITGIAHSLFNIVLPNDYFHHDHYRLILLSLQKYLNLWMAIALIFLIASIGLSLAAKFIYSKIIVNIISVTLKNRKSFFISVLLLLTAAIVGGLVIWLINKHIIPSYRAFNLDWMLGVTAALSALLLGIILYYTKTIRIVTIAVLVLLFSINCINFLFDSIHNDNKPNVILISIDTLRADHLGCYGYQRNTSPNIDQFAKENLLFNSFYVQDNWTLTSHMSMMTSLYPPVHGVTKKKSLAPSIVTLAEVLKNDGYRTVGFAGDCVWMQEKYGFGQGFDSYTVKKYSPTDPEYNGEYENKYIGEYIGDNARKPLFLFIHYFDVHSDFNDMPYDAPDDFESKFTDPYDDSVTVGFGDVRASKYLMYLNQSLDVIKNEELEYIVALYDGGISYIDHCIGELFKKLKQIDQYDNSLIIITSDHGEEFREHGRMLHTQNYEEIMRVPLIIKMPKKDSISSRKLDALAESIDIMPFICDYLNIENRPWMQGQSFLNVIKTNKKVKHKDHVFAFGDKGQAMIKDDEWKLLTDHIMNDEGLKLFNVRKDPGDTDNVVLSHDAQAILLYEKLLNANKKLQKRTGRSQIKLTGRELEKLHSIGYAK